jgi:positive regulator of sigma E activity
MPSEARCRKLGKNPSFLLFQRSKDGFLEVPFRYIMEKGKVIKILNGKTALVKVENPGECDACAGKSSCTLFTKKDNTIEAKFHEKLIPGDNVNIIIKPTRKIFLSMLIFSLPLVFMMLFYFAGYLFFKKESTAALISVGGFALSFTAIIFILKSRINKEKMLPFAVKEKEI